MRSWRPLSTRKCQDVTSGQALRLCLGLRPLLLALLDALLPCRLARWGALLPCGALPASAVRLLSALILIRAPP